MSIPEENPGAAHPPLFLVSVDSKRLKFGVSLLDATLMRYPASVASKQVTG